MAVFRVNKTKDYTVMSNAHLRDKRLSFKAKGILSVMLSLPETWDYSIAGLETLSSDGESATRTALKELETNGYLIRRPIRKNGKISDWEYNIFETPQIEKQVVENPQVEKRPQINTYEQRTKELNTEVSKEERKKYIQSYDEVLNDFGVSGRYKEAVYRFIQHLQLNGVKVINDRLENLIIALDKAYGTNDAAKVGEIDHAITCGFKVVASELSR